MASHQAQPLDELRNSFTEYAQIVAYRWKPAIAALGVVGALAFWASQYLPREYSSTTIFERRDDVVLRNLIHSNSPYSFDTLKSSLVLDVTGSRSLANAAMDMGLLTPDEVPAEGPLSNESLANLDRALGKYKLKTNIHLLNSSPGLDTMQLRCTSSDPRMSSRFVVAVRDRYISDTRKRISAVLERSRDFFAAEADRVQTDAARTSDLLKERYNQFPGLDPRDVTASGSRLESLRIERDRLLERKEELEAQMHAREAFLATAPDAAAPPALVGVTVDDAAPEPAPRESLSTAGMAPYSAELAGLRHMIDQTQREIDDAVTTRQMTRQHPTVAALEQKLSSLRVQESSLVQRLVALPVPQRPSQMPVAPAVQRLMDPVTQQWMVQRMRVDLELDALQRQYEVAKARFDRADQSYKSFERAFNELVTKSDDLSELEERMDQTNATIALWRQHLAQLQRILAAENESRGTQFTLIEEPKETVRAVSPQIGSILVVCFGSGLAAAALLVALVELLDRSFRSASQVSRSLGVPVIESVGVIQTPEEQRRTLVDRAIWIPTLTIVIGVFLLAAGMAYTSLERPDIHYRMIERLDGFIPFVDAPPTAFSSYMDELSKE